MITDQLDRIKYVPTKEWPHVGYRRQEAAFYRRAVFC